MKDALCRPTQKSTQRLISLTLALFHSTSSLPLDTIEPMDDSVALGTSATHPYTCLSCSLAFPDAASQREHYATDLHRYNSKRRVAGLGPVTATLFNDKISERKTEPVEETPSGRPSCKACK